MKRNHASMLSRISAAEALTNEAVAQMPEVSQDIDDSLEERRMLLNTRGSIRRMGTALWGIFGTVVAGLIGGYILLKSLPPATAEDPHPIYAYARAMTTPTPEITYEDGYEIHTTRSGKAYRFQADAEYNGKPIAQAMLDRAKGIQSRRAAQARINRTDAPDLTDVIDEIYQEADADNSFELSKDEVTNYLNP